MAHHDSHGAPAQHGHGHGAHGAHDEHHPNWTTYWKVAVVLTIITAVEVSAYYIPAWENSWIYVPSMLIMSAVKFFIVAAYYMHLKFDHKLFRTLFTGPLLLAFLTLLGLMFLFSKLVINLGITS
ncbi:MAG: cytochrome C oxidase subunit IV family protein [Gemmatimonas sp.]